MKSKKVIAPDCLPMKNPTVALAVCYLVLDKLNAPDLVWGAFGTVAFCVLVAFIAALFGEVYTNLEGFGKGVKK